MAKNKVVRKNTNWCRSEAKVDKKANAEAAAHSCSLE